MENRQNWYIKLIVLHVVLGFSVYLVKPLSYVYGILIFAVGLLYVHRTKNKNNEVLIVIGYIVGSEVLLRMTNGFLVYEVGKYGVILFAFIGMFYRGFSYKSFIFAFCVLLLLPSVLIGMKSLNYSTNVRKAITFNLLGPVTLLITAMYCYKKTISPQTLRNILISISLPICSILVYLFLYTPSNRVIFKSTDSNFAASGGFGPNQVSTILGLAMFTFFTLFLLYSKTKREVIVNIILFMLISYRGVITFSRGGVFAAVGMITVLLALVFFYSKNQVKFKIIKIIFGVLIAVLLVWSYSLYKTEGLIGNRFANQDARGRVKQDRLGGREEVAGVELELFKENLIFGIGVGKGEEERKLKMGMQMATHNELTRMLSEHGILGILIILILVVVPLVHSRQNKNYLMTLPFFMFWLLTINHAAMRLAAPAAIYALSLLQLKKNEDKTHSLPRK